jgi:hypothetical protein
VLERLLVEGTFDREESQAVNTVEEFAMQHTFAIGLRLLARMEDLECCVCCNCHGGFFQC